MYRQEGEDTLFLLLRAYEYWDFPKGMVESGEAPLEGATREVEEETTITDLTFHWGKRYIETGPYNQGKVARYYIAETRQIQVDLPINPEIGRPEHEEFKWVTFDEAKKMVTPRVAKVLRWARNSLSKPKNH